jgi:hypothetical protein
MEFGTAKLNNNKKREKNEKTRRRDPDSADDEDGYCLIKVNHLLFSICMYKIVSHNINGKFV